MNELQKAIMETEKYSLRYGQKLTDKQLWERLISKNVFEYEQIKGLGEKKKQSGEWKEKMKIVKNFSKNYFETNNNIQMVAVTGSVAAEDASKDEDIDLLIITKKNQLWKERLRTRYLVLINKIPHRKIHRSEKENELCFNLWMAEDNLEIPVNKQNLKNAMDAIMMKVILNKDKTKEKFFEKNGWIKNFLATGYRQRRLATRNKRLETRYRERGGLTNHVLFVIQYVYMWLRSNKKIENINLKQAFFHNEGKDEKKGMSNLVKILLSAFVLLLAGAILFLSLSQATLERTLKDEENGDLRVVEVFMGNGYVYKLPYPGNVRSNPLYLFKRLRNWSWKKITQEKGKKIELSLILADKKLAESIKLDKMNKKELAFESSQDGINELKYSSQLLLSFRNESELEKKYSAKIRLSLEAYKIMSNKWDKNGQLKEKIYEIEKEIIEKK